MTPFLEHSNDLLADGATLQALYAITRVLALHSGQREMLSDVLGVLEAQLGMSRGTIMLLSPDGSELLVEAARSIESPQQEVVRYHRGEGITGKVLETGVPAIVPLISEEPQFQDRLHKRGLGAARRLSFICVPIVVGKDVLGTLSVDLPYDERPRLEQNQQILSIVASMVANDAKARRDAAAERSTLEAENIRLRSRLEGHFRPENIVGNSHPMREVYQTILQVAASDTTVLIRGESGTGKELVAAAIHYGSQRRGRPFIRVNCATLSETLIESELFGHERGAFTGAVRDRIGRLEEADGGTLFLDEIGEFSPAVQIKLLRVLQEREYERVGSNTTRKADVRIITATNRDLEAAVESNKFRLDLYYRINVFPIVLPPLRDRKDDILLLADHFAQKFAAKMKKPPVRISTSAMNMMLAYHWPGNVRELENCIEHALLLSNDGAIQSQHLPPTLQTSSDPEYPRPGTLSLCMKALAKDMIMDAMRRSEGNISAAARELGITARMVRYKLDTLGIDYENLFKRRGRKHLAAGKPADGHPPLPGASRPL